jgi:pimeloyl-ACP methyl ester carboxylesterase
VWYHFGEDRSTVIVFVHGILSNPFDCWAWVDSHHHLQAYWPEIVKRDTTFHDPTIFLAEYHTGLMSGNYDITQAARDLWNTLNDHDASGHRVLDAPNLLFVTHSMGGIVVRRMLTQYSGSLQEKTIGLALIASPSVGSEYAKNLAPLSRFARNLMALQLRPLGTNGDRNRFLYDLDQDFRRLLYTRALRLDGFEACENVMIGTRFLRHLVVDPESCSRYFGPTVILPGTNHFTAVKPSSPDARVHQELVRFYRTRFHRLAEMTPHLHFDSIQVRPVFDTITVRNWEISDQVEVPSCDEAAVARSHIAPEGYTISAAGAPVLTTQSNAVARFEAVAIHGDTAVVTLHTRALLADNGSCAAPGSVVYVVPLALEKSVIVQMAFNRQRDADLTPSRPMLQIRYPGPIPASARHIHWEYSMHLSGSTGSVWLDEFLPATRYGASGVVASERPNGVWVDARAAFLPPVRQE